MTLPPRILAIRNASGDWQCLRCSDLTSRHLAFVGMPPPAPTCAACGVVFPAASTSPLITD